AVEGDRAGDVVAVAAGQHVRQGGLAGPVGTYDGVDLAGGDVEVEPVEDRPPGDRRVQVRDVQHQPTAPSRLTRMSAWASTAYSIGSSSKTSRQNPLTIIVDASSSVRPRWRQ